MARDLTAARGRNTTVRASMFQCFFIYGPFVRGHSYSGVTYRPQLLRKLRGLYGCAFTSIIISLSQLLKYIATFCGHFFNMALEKREPSFKMSDFEQPIEDRQKFGTARIAESIRLALTVLTLLMAISIVGMTANSLSVYNQTHVASDFLLPLWPAQFNLGPTISLVTGGSIIILSSAISLIASKVPAVSHLFITR